MKEKFKNLRYIFIILLVAIFVSIPLCWKNFYYYYDDGIQHIARAFLTKEAITSGQSSVILGSLENGFGYSWDLFYGPLSSLSIAIVGIIFKNIVVGYKIVLFLGMFLSGISMYCLTKKITADKNVGLLAGILYMTMPYHLTDMYLRGSVGEFLSFIFIPLVFLGLYNLFHEEKRDWLLTIGAVGLILTHNLMTVICATMAFIYLAINLPKLKIKNIRTKLLINIVFILLISSFFWVPMLINSVSARFQVYEPNMMATSESIQNSGLELKQLVITKNDGSYLFEFGPHILIMLCFTIAAFRRIAPEMKKEYIFFLIIGILTTFMSTKYFPWKYLGNKLAIVQFAWRMMEISCFCFSIICAINLGIVIKNFKFIDGVAIGVIASLYVAALAGFVPKTEKALPKPEDLDYGYVTGRNTDCIIGSGKNEYLPYNAYNNYFYIATREKTILPIQGSFNIEEFKKENNKMTAKVEVLEDETILELPFIYYSGYTVKLDGSEIPSFEDSNGFLSIGLNKISKSNIEVEYTGTSGMRISKIISIISFITFIGYIITINVKNKKVLKNS